VVVSKFDDLAAAEQIAALRHLAKASFTAAIGAYATLATRGLISPDELNQFLQPVIAEIEQVKHVDDEGIGKFIDAFATLKSIAAKTWIDK
jgi:uncharacterized protein YaaN involved in tellurite resistance